MKVLFILLLACVLASCDHLRLGQANSKALLYHTTAEYMAIPLIRREKNVFFSSPDQRVINSIIVLDKANTEAKPSITSGGIGFTYVNILLKSERGKELKYDISIYS